jgi:O-antigen ligase
MGNVRYLDSVLSLGERERVEHLHNFILDAWYETGWLGLLMLFLFLGSIVTPVIRRLSMMTRDQKILAGVALASVVAILSAGLLSFSYASRQFGSYLMMCLALLAWLTQSVKRT